jgi:hypothetical protein
MLLSLQDVELFFKLHRALMFFVNQRLKVVADDIGSPEEFSSLSPEVRLKVRDAFLSHTDLIESFVDENPAPPSKEDTAAVLRVVVGLIDQFCKQQLNDEYAILCRQLAEKLARKRPSPLLSGSPNTWASGIVRTVGWVNFLHDKSQTPYMCLSDIDAAFGISESTGAAKLATIRKLLRIHQLDPNWTLPSRLDDNPMLPNEWGPLHRVINEITNSFPTRCG